MKFLLSDIFSEYYRPTNAIQVAFTVGLENTFLGRPNHSWSDHRWSVIIEQPIRHLLSQMFQQQINSVTRINSHSFDVTILG